MIRARTGRSAYRLAATTLRLVAALTLAAPNLAAQDAGGDHRWTPPRAESIRRLAETIQEARRTGAEIAARESVLALAKALLDAVPDGGVPLSSERWVGPPLYLQEEMRELSADSLREVIATLDFELEARSAEQRAGNESDSTGGATAAEPNIPEALANRIARDFPASRFEAAARRRQAAEWLEQGNIEAFLDAPAQAGPVEEATAQLRRLATPPLHNSSAAEFAGQPLEPRVQVDWGGAMYGGNPDSPWYRLGVEIRCAGIGDSLYLQGDDELLCFDAKDGSELWKTPFLWEPPEPLPGSVAAPVIHGGLVVATFADGIIACDRTNGELRWHKALHEFLPESSATDPAKTPNAGILVVTPPLSTPRGIGFAVFQLERSSLSARLVLLDERGATLWNRPAGSAQGATYLGLGAACPALAARGDALYLLTNRGFISAHHITDGALLWAESYPTLARSASQDLLHYAEALQSPELICTPHYLIGTPVDSNDLFVWNRADGRLVASIPRNNAPWWGHTQRTDADEFLLATPHGLEQWTLTGGRLSPSAAFALESALPRFTGAPLAAGDGIWLIPCSAGCFEFEASRLRLQLRPLDLGGGATRIDAIAGLLIASSAKETIGYGVVPAPTAGADAARQARYRAQSMLARGQLAQLSDVFLALSAFAGRSELDAALDSQLARWCLVQVAVSATGAEAEKLQPVIDAALALLPGGTERAQHAWAIALQMARRGDFALARHLASATLAAGSEAELSVLPDFQAPAELAVRKLLQEISSQDADGDANLKHEARSAESLENARLSGTATGFADVALRFPFTAAGRRASLDLAARHYRDGARRQALLALCRLTLFEPDTPEAVEARFRIAEIHREEGRFSSARAILEELISRYGTLEVTGAKGKESVAERSASQLAALPKRSLAAEPPIEDDSRLFPAWRSPIDLMHQRDLQVHLLPDDLPAEFANRFLLVARHSLELWDAKDGTPLWTRHFRSRQPAVDEFVPAFADRAALRSPISVSKDAVVLHDGSVIYSLELASGRLRWRFELPPSPAVTEEHIVYIERAIAAEGVLVVESADHRLFAFRIDDASLLWQEELPGSLAGDPKISAGRLLFATKDPAATEVRNLEDGQRVRTLTLDLEESSLVHEPWFVDDERIALPIGRQSRDGLLRVVDINTGKKSWEREFSAPLVRVHRPGGVPFWVIELRWRAQKPSLLGVAPEDGRILWTATFPRSADFRLQSIEYYGGQLYLLEGEYADRRLIALEVYPILLEPEPREGLEPFELAIKYTRTLSKGPDQAQITFHRDWILVRDSYRCDLTVIERESGDIQRSALFRAAKNFVTGRRRLFYAGFVADTLVLFTMRGGMGLRPISTFESLESDWRTLSEIDLLRRPETQAVPLAAAHTAYREGEVEGACRILESLIDTPELTFESWQDLDARLQGISQQRGEEKPLFVQVPHLARTPEIDGSLDEPWSAAFAIPVVAPRYVHRMQGVDGEDVMWHGRHDLSALIFTAWSEEGLHIAIDVTDDNVVPYDKNAKRWTGDCFLLAFDFQDDGGPQPDGNDQLLTLALTVPKPPPVPEAGAEGENPGAPPIEEEESPPGRYQVQRKSDGSGMIYEVTIFWASFREARQEIDETLPHPGMSFRMNVLLTDDDTGRGAGKYMSLSAGQHLRTETREIWDLFIPEYFPRLKLAR